MNETTPQIKGLSPPSQPGLSPRSRLLRKLDSAARWLICGPAGTGKTALAQLWQQRQTQSEGGVWLDLARLPASLSLDAALETLRPMPAPSSQDNLEWPVHLVIDHLEHADSRRLSQLETLLEQLPDTTRLLMLSRNGPPRAAWVLRYALDVLGGESLWWEESELSSWLKERLPPEDDLASVARWLDGWVGPAALYVRARAAGEDAARKWVHQYIGEEVLCAWPDSVRTQAQHLAWLPALTPPFTQLALCEETSGGVGETLEACMPWLSAYLRSGPFGRHLHPLLRDALCADAHSLSSWLDTLEAALKDMDQPLAYCDFLYRRKHWDHLQAQLATHGQAFLKQGYHLYVLDFLEAFPHQAGLPTELVRLKLWALFYADHREALAREIRRLRTQNRPDDLPEDELTLLDMMTRSPRELGRGQAARDALERLRHQSVPVRSVAFFGLATAYYWQGDVSEAHTLCLDALTHAKLEGRYSTVLSASGLLLWLQAIRGETIRALNLLKETDVWLRDFHSGSQAPQLVSCWRNSARVRLHILQGEPTRAWQALAPMKRYVSGAEPAHQAMTGYTEAFWHAYTQNPEAALNRLEEAEALVSQSGHRFSIPPPPCSALRIRCLIQLGRLREARQVQAHLPTSDEAGHPFDKLESLEATALLALHDGQREEASRLAHTLATLAREQRFLTHHISARLILCCIQTDSTARQKQLEQVLDMAASNDLIFPVVQFRPFLRDALARLAHHALLGHFIQRILDYDLSSQTDSTTGQSRLATDALSRRETEVLGLIAEGLANKEIAARLHLAGATVKAHIRNIYSKIGARNRTDAVRIARELALLPQLDADD